MFKQSLVSAMLGSVLLSGSFAVSAATQTTYTDLSDEAAHTFTVGPAAWRDVAGAGGAGWTHNSQWGSFNATAGQQFVLTVDRTANTAAGFHPGVTIWLNPLTDGTVGDHFYPQSGNFLDADDPLNGTVMIHQAHGYDGDGNTGIAGLNPLSDGQAGRLVLPFTVSHSGFFSVVVGGINPSGVTSFQQVSVQLQAVPVPPALWLFGSALLGICTRSRRRPR